ncbi:MAG: YD repeat protein [candidate division Zixibacteria bacterium RBG-1]|nr:MAG: YD repeat protein [candidate division Zixibacteria bacterium RBG-1]OGC83205.1 MAG: hypothetical protein A2V73_06815 [candidate division Zixibacteria bacterium RBG_19FT_COMBO_42_43]
MRKIRIVRFLGLVFNFLILSSRAAPLPPSFMSALNHQDRVVPLYWFKPGLTEREIFYDNDSMAISGYVSWGWDENSFAVKFTVLDTPFVLLKSKVFIDKNDLFPDSAGDQHSPFEITVHLDSNGIPGRLISGPILTSADPTKWVGNGQWVEVSHNNLITKTTDFWIVFHWLQDTPTAPLVGQSNNPSEMKSYWGKREDGVFRWHLWTDYDFMIRAVVLSNSLDDTIILNPAADSFKIYRSDNQSVVIQPQNLLKTFPGNVFQYTDSEVENGIDYFYTITAKYEAGESPPCSSISILPLEKAQISLSEDFLEAILNSTNETTLSVTLSNTGQLPLYYNISIGLKDSIGNLISDAFGYSWKDNVANSKLNFNWVEIEDRGAVIAQDTGNDLNLGPYAVGFPLTFYGNSFDSIRITTNGWLSFTSPNPNFYNRSLPNDSGVFNLIAPFWDDLKLDTGSKVIYFSNPDSTIITYSKIWRHPTGGPYTFQTILTKTGQVVFHYKFIPDTLYSASIGIQNQDGSIGLEVGYNQDILQDSLAVQINPGWMEISPGKGVVDSGQHEILNLKLRRDFLNKGMYQGDLVFKNWDENQVSPNSTIPVTLLIDSVTSVRERPASAAVTFNLSQNYPNPFNQNTVIQYSLPKSSKVELVIYNLLGQKVRSLINQTQTVGYKIVFWDGKNDKGENVASGVYFYKLLYGDSKQTKKMLLLR